MNFDYTVTELFVVDLEFNISITPSTEPAAVKICSKTHRTLPVLKDLKTVRRFNRWFLNFGEDGPVKFLFIHSFYH